MNQLRKPAMKIGNAARKAVQREIRVMSNATPLTRASYDLVETLVKSTLNKKRKKEKKKKGNDGSKQVSAPAVIGNVQSGGAMSSSGYDRRTVSGTETFLSTYRPTEQGYDQGGVFNLSANAPGLIQLAKEAQNYQLYRFTNVTLTYEPVSSTQTQGQILFGALSDPTDAPPESLEDARAVKDSVSTPVWQKTVLRIPCDKTDRYVDGDVSSSSDVRFQVFKRIFIGSTSVTTGTPTGLWTIKYSCVLTKRKPSSSAIATLEYNSQDLPFTSLISRLKSTPYYEVAPSGEIKFLVSGRFRAQLFLATNDDQILPNLTFTNGGLIVPLTPLAFYQGYSKTTDVNQTIKFVSVAFVLRTRGAVLDLSLLSQLTGTGTFLLSIEPDSRSISI